MAGLRAPLQSPRLFPGGNKRLLAETGSNCSCHHRDYSLTSDASCVLCSGLGGAGLHDLAFAHGTYYTCYTRESRSMARSDEIFISDQAHRFTAL